MFFVQDAGLLLVFVDLDIAGRVLILNEQQRGGQGHRQSSEDGEQCFENLHRFKPPWQVWRGAGDVPQFLVALSIA